ncbi:MAG: hypothetical protein KJ060_19580, partial [Candidatus Hydrogenedentes bacterium]|nr:hypothetical protein [Candidatus Hydrogenedentota bacterium]
MAPVDWFEEGQDEIDATRLLRAVLSSIRQAGHEADIIDWWEGTQPEAINVIDVALNDVAPEAFMLFENHYF